MKSGEGVDAPRLRMQPMTRKGFSGKWLPPKKGKMREHKGKESKFRKKGGEGSPRTQTASKGAGKKRPSSRDYLTVDHRSKDLSRASGKKRKKGGFDFKKHAVEKCQKKKRNAVLKGE